MEKFTKLTGAACPINQSNLNTDQILPARYLKWTRAMGFDKVLFHDLRFDSEGREKPDFPLNKPAWRKSMIVVSARNFGCGSSREAAVYALYDFGVHCVSFQSRSIWNSKPSSAAIGPTNSGSIQSAACVSSTAGTILR
jgi:3-isopropylmalate/(R)-2-methylmalate dehydratase small subunit